MGLIFTSLCLSRVMLGDLFEVGLSTHVSTQELQQEGEAKLLNYSPDSKPNSWGKLSDRIQEEELKLRYVLITSCSNNQQETGHPGLPVWLQCGIPVPPTLLRHWRLCSGRQALFGQYSSLKRVCSRDLQIVGLVTGVPGRGWSSAHSEPPGQSHQGCPCPCPQQPSAPRPGLSHAERGADGLIRAGDTLGTAACSVLQVCAPVHHKYWSKSSSKKQWGDISHTGKRY